MSALEPDSDDMDYGTPPASRHLRPRTPGSPQTTRDSLYDATSTIDDLTQALENVSRVASPEPPELFCCCCGQDDCENLRAWTATKSRLQSRLTLSAEVGQALLQRHEAYVRRVQGEQFEAQEASEDDLEKREKVATAAQDHLDQLVKDNQALEKRLTRALVNNEVTEVSNKTILQELAEAKTTISRLTTSAARSVGWDTRLSAALKEKEDMQQERDSESQRARLAESRFAALKERTSKLQSEVRRLQTALEERREHRLESSETIIMDARARLQALHRSVGAPVEQPELAEVLETLVNDSDTLKRDNAELQTLLADAREDCRALQEELEDQRVNPPPRSGAATPSFLRTHFHTGSVPSVMLPPGHAFKRSSSAERRTSRRYEPMTPETNRRPLSPTDSLANSESRWPHLGGRYPISPSHASFEDVQDTDSTLERRSSHRPLFLLARSRGVQTDPVAPLGLVHPPSHSPSSGASVYSESLAPSSANTTTGNISAPSVTLAVLVERTAGLLHRMQTADALSLTNRLKRQQIRGADVGHLSRTTVASIMTDVHKQLRAGGLQDEDMRAGRRDVRSFMAVTRELFTTLGELRVLLNEVVLDPASASRISEAAMDPGKARDEHPSGPATWFTKFLSGVTPKQDVDRNGAISPLAAPRPMIGKFVPKGPALAASATTVNVEVSGARSVASSTFDASSIPSRAGRMTSPAPGVMDIFAGAPRSKTPDPWIVVGHPKLSRKPSALLRPGPPGSRHHPNRMSRNVDAVLDGVGTPAHREGDHDNSDDAAADEEPDYLGPLLHRTLRRRGLSDSSIHSTFVSQAAADNESSTREAAWLEGGSVLQALSKRVQSFRSGLGGGKDSADMPPPAEPTAPVTISRSNTRRSSRSSTNRTAEDSGSSRITSSSSGFGFLANFVPDSSDVARSLREQDAVLSRSYRAVDRGII